MEVGQSYPDRQLQSTGSTRCKPSRKAYNTLGSAQTQMSAPALKHFFNVPPQKKKASKPPLESDKRKRRRETKVRRKRATARACRICSPRRKVASLTKRRAEMRQSVSASAAEASTGRRVRGRPTTATAPSGRGPGTGRAPGGGGVCTRRAGRRRGRLRGWWSRSACASSSPGAPSSPRPPAPWPPGSTSSSPRTSSCATGRPASR